MRVSQLSDKSIFNAAREIDSEDARREYLQRVCGDDADRFDRVAALLRGFEKNSRFLESPAVDLLQASAKTVSTSLASPVLERPGTQIGPYIIREPLGEGGMGVVYVAEQQEPVRRQVALKIIKPGMDSKEVLARFDAERQALAMMSHPNIAKILDGGTTEAGRPYFVMELVKGVSITKFCDSQKLSLRERLDLFVTVCQAVQHAHLKGIIHRDLKPSNILVELHDVTAMPKVIDFGVAKATHQRLTQQTIYTQFAQMIGTPQYMSPEQAQLSGTDVDTRSDVYSLGVVLYELLTGSTPFERTLATAGYDEMRRIIQEEEPPRPSYRISTLRAEALSTLAERQPRGTPQLERQVERELDWIVMKALEKDRVRRYESASALAADIQRHLDGELVQACPPSVGYRLQKYVRRHKGLLATTVVLVATLLIATVVSLAYAFQAEQASRDAQQQSADAIAAKQLADKRLAQSRLDFDRAIKALDTVVELLSSGEFPQITGVAKTRSEMLQRMITLYEEIAQEHGNDPYARQQQALAHGRIGEIFGLNSEHQKAEAKFSQGIAILEELVMANPDDSEHKLSLAHLLYCRLHCDPVRSQAERLADGERALRIHQELVEAGGDEHFMRLALLHERVASLLPHNSLQKIQHLAESIRIPESFGHMPNYAPYIQLAILAEGKGQLDKAEENYRRGMELMQPSVDAGDRDDRQQLEVNLSRLANLLNSRGRFAEATELHLQAIEVARQLFLEYGEFPRYESMLFNRVRAYSKSALTKEQQAEFHQFFGELEAEFPGAGFIQMISVANLIDAGQTEKALADLREAFTAAENAQVIVEGLKTLSRELSSMRHYNDALAVAQLALEHATPQYQDQVHVHVALCEANLGLRRYDQSLAHINHAIGVAKGDRWWLFKRRAEAHFGLNQLENALADLNTALEENPYDLSTVGWIPEENVANCPDEAFRTGMRALADRGVALNERSVGSLIARSSLLLAFGEREQVREDLDAVAAAGDADYYALYQAALLSVVGDDRLRYEKLCLRMLEAFAQSDAAGETHFTAWTCALAPAAIEDYAPLIKLARHSVEKQPGNQQYLNGLGAILMRSGQHADATVELQKALAMGDTMDTSQSYVHYFLAMTEYKLGHQEAAQELLAIAQASAEKELTGTRNWNRKLTLELLRKESEGLIGQQGALLDDNSNPTAIE